jgi:hypothetical protein
MPKNYLKTGSVQGPLELLYRNGQPTTSGQVVIPRFSDISLTKESQSACDDVLDEAKRFDHQIRSDKECQDYIALHSLVDELRTKLRELANNDRAPFSHILAQIASAIEPAQTKLTLLSDQLKKRITEWRAMILEGQRREQERLEREAEEKRNEAKYTDDPKKARQATTAAKQLEKAAKAVAPRAEKGIDTEEYWEGEITSRHLASKLPDDIVLMDIDQTRLNQRIKALLRSGEKITPNFFQGISLTRKTRVRFH